ncbi:peroxidase family protein [Shimia ponticola]|uniref:peroxidase family protein n=1 Tax=Shimia ponticola TaxID=2582893 RepID=UPI00164A1D77|nr:peroxidase family protein [Shimia ponticola]
MPRLTEARYEDGLGELYETTDPIEVSRAIFDQDGDMPSSQNISTLFTTWGQFLDHDLSLTPEGHVEQIEVDAFAHGVGRSEFMDGTGETGPREFGNAITWQIDASMVYGSNAGREADVRSFEDGKLAVTDDPTSTHGLLPKATQDTVMAGDITSDDPVFLAGDVRANENPNLLTLHTLFVREHNYWAERLGEENPDWDDQQIFEVARSIVEHNIQKITYDEWLPHLIGNVIPDDLEHDPDVDGQISLEFSTAAFRFGHTLVSGHMPRLNDDGTVFEDGHLALMDAFFNPDAVKDGGIDALIRGQAAEHAQELDTKVVDDLNFFLATPDGVSGFSLPALNLIRGADHGMGSYVDVRAQLIGDIDPEALDPTDFSILTADEELQAELASVYDTVHDIDLWVGGLAEDNIDGTLMGPLFSHILTDQFMRTAQGDETFNQLDPRLTGDLLDEVLASANMSSVILRTTDIDLIQDDPFVVAPRGLMPTDAIEGTWMDDDIDVTALAVDGSIRTEDGDDTVNLIGGSTVAGKIDTGLGDDVVAMSSGSVRYDIDMGPGDDNEQVLLSGNAIVGDDVRSQDGNDRIELTNMARITDDLATEGGNDRVLMDGKSKVGGSIRTKDDDDIVVMSEQASAGRVALGSGDDVMILSDDAHTDSVHGGSGEDVLSLGSSTYRVEFDQDDDSSGTVFFTDAEGADTGRILDFSGIEDLADAIATQDSDVLVGTLGRDTIHAGSGDDRVLGLDSRDTIMGQSGDDDIDGGTGHDRLNGGSGDDTVSGGSGDDRIAGNSGHDVLGGGAGDDMLRGGSGDDVLDGGSGDDTLMAGSGDDSMTGGAGSDLFKLYSDMDGSNLITDFGEGDSLWITRATEDEIITVLSGQGDGDDTLITSDMNADWQILVENTDLDEDDISLF